MPEEPDIQAHPLMPLAVAVVLGVLVVQLQIRLVVAVVQEHQIAYLALVLHMPLAVEAELRPELAEQEVQALEETEGLVVHQELLQRQGRQIEVLVVVVGKTIQQEQVAQAAPVSLS
jgi:hypothetical protein